MDEWKWDSINLESAEGTYYIFGRMNVILTMNFSAGNYYFEAFKSWPDDSVDDIFVHPLPIRATSQLSQMCTGRKKFSKKIAHAKYWPVSSSNFYEN